MDSDASKLLLSRGGGSHRGNPEGAVGEGERKGILRGQGALAIENLSVSCLEAGNLYMGGVQRSGGLFGRVQ